MSTTLPNNLTFLEPIKHNLQTNTSTIDSLEKINAFLLHSQASPNNNLETLSQHIVQYLTLPLLLEKINTKSHGQLESAIRLLQKLFQYLPKIWIDEWLLSSSSSSSSNSDHDQLIQLGSTHTVSSVRSFVLDQIAKLSFGQLINNNRFDYVQIVVMSLLDDEISIYHKASDVVYQWVHYASSASSGQQQEQEQQQHLFDCLFNMKNEQQQSFIKLLMKAIEQKSTITTKNAVVLNKEKQELYMMRVYELLARIGTMSEKAFDQIALQTHLLDSFLTQLKQSSLENNVLTLLNMLEIVKSWCESGGKSQQIHVVQYFHQKGLFSMILQILMHHQDDELISSFIFHLIAQVAHNQSHQILSDELLCSENDFVFDHLYSSLCATGSISDYSSESVARQKSALIIIGNLCSQSNVALKRFLIQDRQRRETYLSFLMDYSCQDILVTFLHSLAQITEPSSALANVGSEQDRKESLMLLFRDLEERIIPSRTSKWQDNRLMNQLLDIIKTDIFADIRHAVFHVLRSLAYHSWGVQHYLLAHPVFISFLTNRGTEITKEAKDWKYGIAEIMWSTIKRTPQPSQTSNNEEKEELSTASLSTKEYVTLRVFLQRGPYLEDSEAAVTIQSKSA